MSREELILPRADSECGKVFHSDRRTANGHRIALAFWNRATGHIREGYQLAVYRCSRCGGFHIGQKRIRSVRVRPDLHDLHHARLEDRSKQGSLDLRDRHGHDPHPPKARRTASQKGHIASGSSDSCQGPKALPVLIAIDSAAAIAETERAYESFDVPKGTLRGAPPVPEDDLTTLRTSLYLVANKKLGSDLVATLTQTIMSVRRDLLAEEPIFAQITAPKAGA